MKRDWIPLVLASIFAFVAIAGTALPQWFLFILTLSFATGLVALGLMLLLRAGLVSFGQALYYCTGAYTAGMTGRYFKVSDLLAQMALAALAAGLLAFILGFLLARYRGIFFGLLSLALSMILYGLIVKNEALGSTDGINLAPATILGARPDSEWLRYIVAVVGGGVALGCALIVHRYAKTPLGRLAPAIKDNEIRVEYMGASARQAIHATYVIAAVLAGIGGGLAASTVGHIDPEMAYWTTSGEFIFITILAGTGNVIAPFAGALIYGAIRTTAYDLSPNTWQLSLGTALLLIIVFLPEGFWSLFKRHARHP
jgi:branched-chain amino acid transport system permease protein